MSVAKPRFEDTLAPLALSGSCYGCAACVAVCPIDCLEYGEEVPRQVQDCNACGVCLHACPRYGASPADLETMVFGRERRPDEDFGIYRRIVLAQCTDPSVLNASQDGGLVTTLLAHALDSGVIDGAALSGVSEDVPFLPVPVLATTRADVLRCAGARYSNSPTLLAYGDGVNAKLTSLAAVGTPCQVQALRRIQYGPLKKYSRPLKVVIGLMCSKSFSYGGLMEEAIQAGLGIDLHDIQKVNIKGKVLVTKTSGEVETLSLKELTRYVRAGCNSCTDFAGELADISAGGLGLDDQTFAIIRTEIGDEIVDGAERAGLIRTSPVEEDSPALQTLLRSSRRKRPT